MKTVIAPTDFSPVSVNALNFAADMALAIDANLVICNIYNIPVAFSEVPLILVSPEELKQSSELQLQALQQQVVQRTEGKLTVMTEARMGNITDELESLCERVQPFAVVMGAKGKTGLEKVIFGSTALSAIRHLAWPVICVPPGKEYGKGISKIGLACDFRNVEATTPVVTIKHIVMEFKSELHILNVDYNEKHFSPGTPLESFHLHAMFNDMNPKFHFINNPDVEDGINEFAEKNNLDLIIAIPKKHKLLEAIFKPSSTRQLIFQSHIPLMCVHE